MYSLIEAGHYVDQRILVVGGGDSAVEAAMGLAVQKGNKVTLSYRKDTFSRLKDRNDSRIRDFMRKRKLEVIFNSQPEEIHPDHVVLRVEGGQRKLPNDYVWVFAGGTPPNAFLEKIGVQVGMADLTEATAEGPRQVA
jgi:thioredoxin reductase